MEHAFKSGNAEWLGHIPPTPTNLVRKAHLAQKAATNVATLLEQTLRDCEQPHEEIERIVAAMRDASARLAKLVPTFGQADAAYEAREREQERQRIATAKAAADREFAELQAQWRGRK